MLIYKNLLNCGWWCCILIFFLFFIISNASNFEIFFKINSNLPYLSFISFWWSSFRYIYVFWLIVLIFVFIRLNLMLVGTVCYIFYYFLNEQFSIQSNYLFLFCDFDFMQLNSLLLNNLNKYHPFLLYCGFSSFLILVVEWAISQYTRIADYRSSSIMHFHLFLCRLRGVIKLGFFALILGAWWAQQEGSWGGWWNWDPSENLILLIFVYGIYFFHIWIKTSLCQKFNFLIFNWNYLFNFWLIYFFLQLNFEFLSHNFGLKFFFFFNNNLFFEVCCFCLFVVMGECASAFYRYKNVNGLSAVIHHYSVKIYIYEFYFWIICLIFLNYFISTFFQLSGYFFWTFFNFSFSTILVSHVIANFCFLWILFYWLKKKIALWAWVCSFTSWTFAPYALIVIFKNFFFFFHIFIYFFFFLAKLATHFLYLYYFFINFFNIFNFNFFFVKLFASNFSLDSPYVEIFILTALNNLYDASVSIIAILNIFVIFVFMCFFSNTFVSSLYVFNGFFDINRFSFIVINYFLNHLVSLLLLFWLIFALFYYTRLKKTIY